MSVAETLTALALDVGGGGFETADWRMRGLAELLVQAYATQDKNLVRAVDRAAAHLCCAAPRFSDRFRLLRQRLPGAPPSVPGTRLFTPVQPPPPLSVRLAAMRVAWAIDTCLPISDPHAEEPSWRSACDVARDIERLGWLRPSPRLVPRCVGLDLDKSLVWRGWFLDDSGPVLGFVAQPHTEAESRLMYGLHVGIHLDHLGALVHEGRGAAARRLQFGRGLLLAEATAMAVELAVAADPSSALGERDRAFLRRSLLSRLARLPQVERWGPRLLADSPAMGAAARLRVEEFVGLPTLAAAYVSGPFRLAADGFHHELLPESFTRSLRELWPYVDRVSALRRGARVAPPAAGHIRGEVSDAAPLCTRRGS